MLVSFIRLISVRRLLNVASNQFLTVCSFLKGYSVSCQVVIRYRLS